jgi:hypothetical protein
MSLELAQEVEKALTQTPAERWVAHRDACPSCRLINREPVESKADRPCPEGDALLDAAWEHWGKTGTLAPQVAR